LDPAFVDILPPSHSTQLPRQVHTITDRFSMSNTYLLDDQQLVMVDPGSELNVHLSQHYIQHFLRRTLADVDLIVLTHLHADHTAGVQEMRRLSHAPVAASSAVLNLVQDRREGWVMPKISHLAEQVLPGPLHHLDLFPPLYAEQMKLVDLWLNEATALPGHPSWNVLLSPGHTPDSLCLYNPSTWELLCGDTVITIGGGAPLLRSGSNRRQLEATLRTLRNLQVFYLYPGHGRPILARRPLSNVDVEW
jgi:hydroxyacylglutathione hydrolase